ncbi:MAG TPA: hypothetical protein VGL71_10725, partial [Urbifossiella sp.]
MPESLPMETELRNVEPALRLVPVRRLRKVLHYLRDHGRAVPLNPDLPLWCSREELTSADVLPPSLLSGNEDPLLLITTPVDRSLDDLPPPKQLRAYWELLFQAGVAAALDRQRAEGRLTPAECGERLAQFGPAAVREIRFVLESDHQLEPAADAAALYRAFAAAYLGLQAFTPTSLGDEFPSLPAVQSVLDVLNRDVDTAALLERSRPAGAADAFQSSAAHHGSHTAPKTKYADLDLLAMALEAEERGNYVRAAILRTQQTRPVEREIGVALGSPTRALIGKLVGDLAGVFRWNETTQRHWVAAILPLLEPASTGFWPRAARCLYELQKIPGDLAREVFAVDLVEPIRTLGRRPIKRPLPHARTVMLLLKLRAAHKQLVRSGVEEHSHKPLDELFHHEIHHLEIAVRRKLSPIVAAAMKTSGFHPANRVEEAARDKLVAELLDRVCE